MSQSSSKNNYSTLLRNIPTYRAGVAQSAAYRTLRHVTESALSPHDITMMQWFIIGTINDAGEQGVTVSALSRQIGTNLPYITNSLHTLESKKIIRRIETADNRQKRVVVNTAYKSTIETIENDLRAVLKHELYGAIEPRDLAVYVKVLFQLQQFSSAD